MFNPVANGRVADACAVSSIIAENTLCIPTHMC